jgi:hypothetical protein
MIARSGTSSGAVGDDKPPCPKWRAQAVHPSCTPGNAGGRECNKALRKGGVLDGDRWPSVLVAPTKVAGPPFSPQWCTAPRAPGFRLSRCGASERARLRTHVLRLIAAERAPAPVGSSVDGNASALTLPPLPSTSLMRGSTRSQFAGVWWILAGGLDQGDRRPVARGGGASPCDGTTRRVHASRGRPGGSSPAPDSTPGAALPAQVMLGARPEAGERSQRSGIQPGRAVSAKNSLPGTVLGTWCSTRSRLDQEQLAGTRLGHQEQLCRLRVIEGRSTRAARGRAVVSAPALRHPPWARSRPEQLA